MAIEQETRRGADGERAGHAGAPILADGAHADTTALRRSLAALGVVAPHTGAPLSEAMLLGTGGGLGGGYWTFEFTGAPKALVIGTRHQWHQAHLFLAGLCERLGQPFTVHETGSARVAANHLAAALAAGRRPLAWVDLATLPYAALGPQWEKFFISIVGVRGIDPHSGDLLVDDRAAEAWPVTAEQFAAARKAIPYNKQRLLVPEPRAEPLGDEQLRVAVLEGIRAGVAGLLEPPIKNFGLPAIEKWADLVASRKQKKGWPTVFAAPADLMRALGGVHHAIGTNGTGGGAFRPLYAAFLDEAAEVLGRPALGAVAEAYRALGRQWTALALAALPEAIPLLREARELASERDRLHQHVGVAALPRIQEIGKQLASLEARATEQPPLTQADIDDLLADLEARIRAIYTAEVAAARQLGDAAV